MQDNILVYRNQTLKFLGQFFQAFALFWSEYYNAEKQFSAVLQLQEEQFLNLIQCPKFHRWDLVQLGNSKK